MTISPPLDGTRTAPLPGDAAEVGALLQRVRAAIDSVREVPRSASAYRAADDAALIDLQRLVGVERQLVDAHAAAIAGEIARRSSAALGQRGLAQRQGFRTPEELVRVTTRSSARDASAAVRVGRLGLDAQPGEPDEVTGLPSEPEKPWLSPVMDAVTAGSLPAASAEAISAGLGDPAGAVTVELLRDAAEQLCVEAVSLDADRLFTRARRVRDLIDEAGVADRERERRARRSLRITRLPDGMARLSWLMDPETAAQVGALFDRATSPKRGGPRFVDPASREHAAAVAADERTAEQLASDEFLGLLTQGADRPSDEMPTSGAPSVRILITATDLDRGGIATIEGESEPVSISTVERMICNGSTLPIVLDAGGHPLDVGREQRLFTRRQRIALAARDGGCMFLDCSRPASWTEAHHLQPWSHGGGTDVENGILLCRHHHLLLHDEGWEITRHGDSYWLIPPEGVDPGRAAIRLHSKSPTYDRHLEQVAAERAAIARRGG